MFVTRWYNVWVTFVTFNTNHDVLNDEWTEKPHNFCFRNTSQIPSNKLMSEKPAYIVNKKPDFLPKIKKKVLLSAESACSIVNSLWKSTTTKKKTCLYTCTHLP